MHLNKIRFTEEKKNDGRTTYHCSLVTVFFAVAVDIASAGANDPVALGRSDVG